VESESILSHRQRRNAMSFAILSSCFGAVSVATMRDSSVILLYATVLGAGEFFSMFTTAIQPLAIFLLVLPFAHLMERTRKKSIMMGSLLVCTVAFMGVAAAGFAGARGRCVMILCLTVFAAMMSIYTAGWMPLLRSLVPDRQAGRFFGRQRLSVQVVSTGFLLFTSLVVGSKASLPAIQLILAIAGFFVLGRLAFLSRIPEMNSFSTAPSFLHSVQIALANKQLMRFSGYLFLLSFLSGSGIAVTFLFANRELAVPDSYLILLTLGANIGAIIGYGVAGRLCDRCPTGVLLLVCHLLFFLLNLCLFMMYRNTISTLIAIFVIVSVYGAAKAFLVVTASSGMFPLVGLDNPNIRIGLWYTFFAAGTSLSRILAGLLLNSGRLLRQWTLGRPQGTEYRVLFLIFALGLGISAVFSLTRIRMWDGAGDGKSPRG